MKHSKKGNVTLQISTFLSEPAAKRKEMERLGKSTISPFLEDFYQNKQNVWVGCRRRPDQLWPYQHYTDVLRLDACLMLVLGFLKYNRHEVVFKIQPHETSLYRIRLQLCSTSGLFKQIWSGPFLFHSLLTLSLIAAINWLSEPLSSIYRGYTCKSTLLKPSIYLATTSQQSVKGLNASARADTADQSRTAQY